MYTHTHRFIWHSLQHTTVHCGTLQHTAALCGTLQHTATHCIDTYCMYTHTYTFTHVEGIDGGTTPSHRNTLNWHMVHVHTLIYIHTHVDGVDGGTIPTHCNTPNGKLLHIHTHMYISDTHRFTLQYTAAHCNTLHWHLVHVHTHTHMYTRGWCRWRHNTSTRSWRK